ncbi:MAG TPA: hypothetical protein DCS93_35985, partial [Microscillaceae bacterium]|nr:hypothetical protein [Microscillaceae bacterium]
MGKMNPSLLSQWQRAYAKGSKTEQDIIKAYKDSYLDAEDLGNFHKLKTFTDAALKSLGKEMLEQMVQHGIISRAKLDELFPPPSREEQKRNIEIGIAEGRYNDNEIFNFVLEGIITQEELKSKALISDSRFDRIYPQAIEVAFGNWANVPDTLREGRVDVFVLGMAGSGKSCFMAG